MTPSPGLKPSGLRRLLRLSRLPTAAKPQPAPEEAPAAPAPEEKAPRGGGVRAALAPLLGKKAPIPLPGLDLLAPPTKTAGGPAREDREARGKALIACLKDFDIQGELVRITPGPVVTMYEVRPAPGIQGEAASPI